MRKFAWLCLIVVTVTLGSLTSTAIAKQSKSPTPYAENFFNWWSEVPDRPISGAVVSSLIKLNGTGGIKINAVQEPGGLLTHGGYQVSIDGSGIAPSTLTAVKVDSDFIAAVGTAYFVSRSATCTLPSAVGAGGKEILVWNAGPASSVKYETTSAQTISGTAASSLTNSSPYSLNRFMSDGENWFKE